MEKLLKKSPAVARTLLGLAFLVFGLNGLLHFMPMPEHNAEAGAFLAGLSTGGFFFPLLKLTEIAAGLLLLSNRWVPLALILLAPITVNIVAFHLFLEPSGMPMAALFTALQIYIAWAYRASYRTVLEARVEPEAARTRVQAPA